MQRIYLKLEDIEKLRSCSKPTASRYVSFVLDLVGKKKGQRLTVYDFCSVEQIKLTDVSAILEL